jgi:excisionase family DNA binding protein
VSGKRREDRLISSSEAGRILGVSNVTVNRWADAGKLGCTRTELGRLFSEAAVRALADERAREKPVDGSRGSR